ncbi:FecR family protein [Arenibacter sp. S6351L]|uniref:FecR family protein n=1 Tax=Arenibacter sp. S6351L TaxID=2926407 RepID=UPI001FF57488|nr:FecR family protein [Arenibacter sp. S6351L]MCK0136068.1 FecR family protein [Arenibacter sp. S6351L]
MDIARIIAKKIKGHLSDKEQEFLDLWINESEENQNLFLRIMASGDERNISVIAQLDDNKEWEKTWKKYNNKRLANNKAQHVKSMLRYAAVFVGLIGLGYGYWHFNLEAQKTTEPEDSITLLLENGETLTISPESQQTITNVQGKILGEQKGDHLDYSNPTKTKKLVYNTLTVPNGRRFSVVLSDSTIVHLNAGSSLKYPVKFIEHQNRQVFLNGEAFFDVTKNESNPFIVTSGTLDVRVLGTKFNISSYPEDRQINTVLVEGAVSLYSAKGNYDPKKAFKLEPGYKAAWDRLYENTELEEVDTDIYTGWIQGKLILKETSFRNIIQKLQRHYKVSIDNKYEKLNNEVFTATFDIETIEEALKIFDQETPFEYTIEGNNIIIYEPKTN